MGERGGALPPPPRDEGGAREAAPRARGEEAPDRKRQAAHARKDKEKGLPSRLKSLRAREHRHIPQHSLLLNGSLSSFFTTTISSRSSAGFFVSCNGGSSSSE